MATEVNLTNDDVSVASLTASGDVTANAFFGDGSNLTGISGGGGVLEAAKAYMSSSSTVNSNTNFVQFGTFPSSAAGLEINIGGFDSAISGIDVPSDGTYIVMASMYYTSTVARANPEFRFSINGTGQNEQSASSYIRSASGHNESSSSLTTIYTLVAGDRIGLQFREQGESGFVTLETNSHVAIYRVG